MSAPSTRTSRVTPPHREDDRQVRRRHAGAGAAGGLGAGLPAFLGARLRPGTEIVMAAVEMDEVVADADLVVTGEGRIDGQTIHGKTPSGWLPSGAARETRHRHRGQPRTGLRGGLRPRDRGRLQSTAKPCSLAEALAEGAVNLRHTARNVAATLKIGGF